ncbi:hypothetical protein A6A29_38280 [Streptomyces sp. TSRI0281]|nr:hypothetical protein A6A29_38280 [Streptomyces sp. TSRI0281]
MTPVRSFPKDDSSRIADLKRSDIDESGGKWYDVGAAWSGGPGTPLEMKRFPADQPEIARPTITDRKNHPQLWGRP